MIALVQEPAGEPGGDRGALRDREKAMLSFALEIAQEEIHARSLDITDQDKAALVSLRRMSDEAQQPCTDRRVEPIHCGLCLYGSDVGVPGYDDKGPAYTNPACPDHNTEATPGVCICGHTEQQHFEDVCQTCGCGDYLEPRGAAEVIDHWRQAALKARADRAAVLREAADELATAFGDPKAKHIGILAASWLRRRAREIEAGRPESRRMADETATTETPGKSCAHCGQPISRITGTLAAWWVHDPGGNTVCHPERAASSTRATPKAADDEPAAGARQDGAQSPPRPA
ncbi:hypothetical protein [Streptomyces fungicidicus]|uniref:hypothetical protein n=1 Tax=Streptomyces fungicidicus TaxID=68203 RepID=UPI00380B31E7